MLTLRPYQDEIIGKLREALIAYRHVLLVLSTGGGKTALASFMAYSSFLKGKRIIFCVHRDFLLDQTAEAFKEAGIDSTFLAAGRPFYHKKQVIIASIDTLKRRIHEIASPDLLIVDEAIHAAAGGWAKVIEHYQSKGCYTIGLCACPERGGGKGLKNWFKKIVEGPSMEWLIQNGYLSKFKVFAPSRPDLKGVHTQGGEYVTKEVSERMNKPSITGNAIAEYKKIADGKQGIAFCCDIKHSRDVCAAFIEAGYKAAHIGSDTPKIERKNLIKDFRNGNITILTSVNIFSEGFDLPAVEYGAFLRPTKSLNIYLQQVGRILRSSPGKEYAFIADHADNVREFGLPDEKREWTLEDKEKSSRENDERKIPVRQCMPAIDADGIMRGCYHCFKPAPVCPNCGRLFPVESREIETKDGELKELEIQAIKKQARMEVGQAKTLADLKKIQIDRGYAPGWVFQMARVKGIK